MSDWRADIKMTRAEELARELFKANKRIAELEALLQNIVDETAHLAAYPPSIERRIVAALEQNDE